MRMFSVFWQSSRRFDGRGFRPSFGTANRVAHVPGEVAESAARSARLARFTGRIAHGIEEPRDDR